MNQHRQPQYRFRRNILKCDQRMGFHIINMVRRPLLHPDNSIIFRQNDLCNPKLPGLVDPFRMGGNEQLHQLHPNPFGADIFQVSGPSGHSFLCFRINRKA